MTRYTAVLFALAACAEEAPGALGLSQSPVPPGLDAFVVSELIPGNAVRLTWADLPPNANVTFAVSATAGVGPCPPFLQGACFGLTNPTIVGRATADAAGVATIERIAPSGLTAGTYHWQAVARAPGIDPILSEVYVRGTGFSICPRIFAPVCAYNGLTYDNDCMAAVAGWPVRDFGFCP